MKKFVECHLQRYLRNLPNLIGLDLQAGKTFQKPIQYATTENFLNHFNVQKLSDLPTVEELGSAGLIDTSTIDKSIFGTGKFFKEQSLKSEQNIYEDIEEAIKKAPETDK